MTGVPRNCLDWCRGIPVDEGEFCALSHARKISRCFDDGRYTLPSPPRNVRVTPVSENSVRAEWEQPEKNAEMVELYRIMWREEGSRYVQPISVCSFIGVCRLYCNLTGKQNI